MTSYQQLLTAVTDYVGLDTIDDSRQLCDEAQFGNKVAQYILGMALVKIDQSDAEAWLRMSARQGYEPAIRYFDSRHLSSDPAVMRGRVSLASH